MRKIYKELTKEQIKEGVIFTSTLSKYTVEDDNDTIHKVYRDNNNRDLIIDRLLNDSFFNRSNFKYNIIKK